MRCILEQSRQKHIRHVIIVCSQVTESRTVAKLNFGWSLQRLAQNLFLAFPANCLLLHKSGCAFFLIPRSERKKKRVQRLELEGPNLYLNLMYQRWCIKRDLYSSVGLSIRDPTDLFLRCHQRVSRCVRLPSPSKKQELSIRGFCKYLFFAITATASGFM